MCQLVLYDNGDNSRSQQAEGQLCPVAAATALTKSERQQGCNEGQKQTDTTNTK
uniref:Uncharacterized protein n=1 Tax=Caudovirales sp. ctTVN2 TaxID=2827634 RepID=A0A8S5S904_9CAUD|nr:MAG TPA: hypothetical protein [Caudovirales sp. ctTVN2]